MTHLIIVGAGAVGSVLAGLMIDAGHDVTLVATPRRTSEINEGGLRIRTGTGVHRYATPVVTDIELAGADPDSVILLTLKTQHVYRWVHSAGVDTLLDDVPVVTLQNGLAAEDIVARRFSLVHPATVKIAANYLPGGEVISGRAPIQAVIALGDLGGGFGPSSARIADALEMSPAILVERSPDMEGWKRRKLYDNVTNVVDLFDDPVDGSGNLRDEVNSRLQEECTAVIGTDFPDWSIDISGFARDPRSGIQNHQRSTWQSFNRGDVDSELDFLNGEVHRLGLLRGVPTPVNRKAQLLVTRYRKDLASGRRLPLEKLLPVTETVSNPSETYNAQGEDR